MPLKVPRNSMPTQEPQERINNFKEVALGYELEIAKKEAERCLQCKRPFCKEGCPVEVDIPEFIQALKEDDMQKAIDIIRTKNSLPAVCGRVCPQENQCEMKCVLSKQGEAVAIGRLERFVADWEAEHGRNTEEKIKSNGKKVAIVGAGPAGLTCAGDLAKMGYDVTVFEALHTPGGVLMYGIPEFRLPKAVVKREIEYIESLGVKFENNSVVGKLYDIEELFELGFQSIFIGTGAGLPYFMNIPGENLNGVYSANEFLTRTNLMSAYDFPNSSTPIKVGKKVAIVGAGNVAIDAARTALRLGAEESYIVYRRSRAEMPARLEEIEHAEEEGVKFLLLTSPIKINDDGTGTVKSMTCIRYELGEPDQSGRRSPVAIENSEFTMEIDNIIMAIGQGPNPLIPSSTPNLQTNRKGNIVTFDEDGLTSIEGVYAGGDIVTGAATVILAMGAGKKAARAIDKYLTKQS